MADVGVGGGASKTFAWVFRNVGGSVEAERLMNAADLGTAGEDNVEVWRDSLGLLGAAGLVGGMTLLWRLGLGSCERMGKSIMTAGA